MLIADIAQQSRCWRLLGCLAELLKLFVDVDTNMDGLVSRASFPKIIDAVAATTKAYGYASTNSELYTSGAVNSSVLTQDLI